MGSIYFVSVYIWYIYQIYVYINIPSKTNVGFVDTLEADHSHCWFLRCFSTGVRCHIHSSCSSLKLATCCFLGFFWGDSCVLSLLLAYFLSICRSSIIEKHSKTARVVIIYVNPTYDVVMLDGKIIWAYHRFTPFDTRIPNQKSPWNANISGSWISWNHLNLLEAWKLPSALWADSCHSYHVSIRCLGVRSTWFRLPKNCEEEKQVNINVLGNL